MLDAHSDIAVAPETHFVRRYWQRRDAYGPLDDDSRFDRLLRDMSAIPAFREMGLDGDQFQAAALGRPRTYPALFSLLLEQFVGDYSVRVVGEKTPDHLSHMLELKGFFPEAKFVHIVRDPRAVVNSYRSVHWSGETLTQDANRWCRKLAQARRLAPRLGGDLLTVSYESLVENPERSLRAVCAFLAVSFDPAMLDYHRTPPATIDVAREPWKRNVLAPPDPSARDRWRAELSGPEVAEVEAAAYFEMQRWGYAPETGGLLGRAAVRAGARAAGRVRAAARHRVRRLLAHAPFPRRESPSLVEGMWDGDPERRHLSASGESGAIGPMESAP